MCTPTTLIPVVTTLGKMTIGVKKLLARDFPDFYFTTHIGTSWITGKVDAEPTACVIAKVLPSLGQ